jgi:hypothetical protein
MTWNDLGLHLTRLGMPPQRRFYRQDSPREYRLTPNVSMSTDHCQGYFTGMSLRLAFNLSGSIRTDSNSSFSLDSNVLGFAYCRMDDRFFGMIH